MSLRLDPALRGPTPDAAPGRLGSVEPPVSNAGPAGPAPFLLDGERLAVTGTELRGDHAFWTGRDLVARALVTNAGMGANVVVAPATLRRELAGALGTVVETTLVAPTLPLAAVQWAAPAGGRWPGRMEIALTLLPGRRAIRYHADGGTVRCAAEDAPGITVELRVHPDPEAWSVTEAAEGGMEVKASVPGPAPVTLLLAAGDGDAPSRAVAAAVHLGAHESRAASDADPTALETLVTSTGVAELDYAVVWASFRLRSAFARGVDGPADDVFWSGRGALAVGDDVTGARALEAVGRLGPGPEPRVFGSPAPREALAMLLAARLTLLTGDPAPARGAWAALDRAALAERRAADPDSWTIWSHALTTLADALRFAASETDIASLRETAAPPGAGGAVRLPMVGDPAREDASALLRRLLVGPGGSPPRVVATEGTPFEAWARWAADDPTGAYAVWRGHSGLGLASGKAGRGTWDPPSHPPGAPPGAGILLCGLAHGLLGLVPDAPSGRIRVAPALPAHLTSFEVRGIRVGETRFTLRFQRKGRTHGFELEPTRGRVPAMVVFEPSFPGTRVAEARVDGVRADLEARSTGSRTRVAVQIPLDAPRSLEVRLAG